MHNIILLLTFDTVSAPLNNGNIKEIEFEFENKIEVTYHFEGIEVLCISKQ